jgi:hypothetical protein
MSITAERPMSATIYKLRRIQPGERIIYYRGALESDLDRAEGDYRALLEDIKDEAARLHREGVVDLHCVRIERHKTWGKRQTRRWPEWVYSATGRGA